MDRRTPMRDVVLLLLVRFRVLKQARDIFLQLQDLRPRAPR